MKKQYRLALIGMVAVVLVAAVAFTGGNQADPEAMLSLQAPSFVHAAPETGRTGAPPEVVTLLTEEAGISAYFQASAPINLDDVRDQFRTVEVETSDYIIGSVPVPNYDETEDVHVYVHVDGWVLAYYRQEDPTAKIFDWFSYDGTGINTTRLRNVLAVMAGAMGSPFPGPTYYDFRYPNATHMMFVVDHHTGGWDPGWDSFDILLPGNYGYFDRSWSYYADGYDNCGGDSPSKFTLDGDILAEYDTCGDTLNFTEGTLAAAQLLPDVNHTFTLEATHIDQLIGGLILIYRVE